MKKNRHLILKLYFIKISDATYYATEYKIKTLNIPDILYVLYLKVHIMLHVMYSTLVKNFVLKKRNITSLPSCVTI